MSYTVEFRVDLREPDHVVEFEKKLAPCKAFYKLAAEHIEADREYRITTSTREEPGFLWVFRVRADP